MIELNQNEAARRFFERVPIGSLQCCWNCSGKPNPDGYGLVTVQKKSIRAHRLAWFVFYGRWPWPMALHKCGNRKCANPFYIYEGNAKQNAADAIAAGTWPAGDRHHARLSPERLARGERHGSYLHPEKQPRGEKHGCAKLTVSQVRLIRERCALGESRRSLGREFGVSKTTIARVVDFKNWKSVSPLAPVIEGPSLEAHQGLFDDLACWEIPETWLMARRDEHPEIVALLAAAAGRLGLLREVEWELDEPIEEDSPGWAEEETVPAFAWAGDRG